MASPASSISARKTLIFMRILFSLLSMAHLTGVGAYREQTKNKYQVKNAGRPKKNRGSAKSNR
jgi:hypothetical protein